MPRDFSFEERACNLFVSLVSLVSEFGGVTRRCCWWPDYAVGVGRSGRDAGRRGSL